MSLNYPIIVIIKNTEKRRDNKIKRREDKKHKKIKDKNYGKIGEKVIVMYRKR